jgi:TetR/AcrR family transcriptional regulator, tetracycline repressor protein
MALQRKDVVIKGLEILQRDGVDGLTLRKLAAELNIKAASLYTHVKSKRDLLDEMAEEILHAKFPTMPEPKNEEEWQTWFKRIVHDVRAALLKYRDGGVVAAGVNPRRAKTYAKLGAHMLTVLCENYGFSVVTAGTLVSTALVYTYGSVIEEQNAPSTKEIQEAGVSVEDYFSPEMKQRLATAAKEPKNTAAFFDQALDLIMHGVVQLET